MKRLLVSIFDGRDVRVSRSISCLKSTETRTVDVDTSYATERAIVEAARRKIILTTAVCSDGVNPKLVMPFATSGFGECTICFEVVPCVKVLDCKHTVCLTCTTKLATVNQHIITVTCPECRQPTDCSLGFHNLKTLYFGKIQCDHCLQNTDADDMWWCRDCVTSLCSKCSILRHSQRQHSLSEWDKMDQVQFSVSYIDRARYSRQQSVSNISNQQLIKHFLKEVETALYRSLSIQPELEEIKQNLLSRYGTRFDDDHNPTNCLSSPTILSGGSKLVAKVLQFAGESAKLVVEIDDRQCRVDFKQTPEQVADFVRSAIELRPIEVAIDRRENDEKLVKTVSKVINRCGSVSQVLDLDLDSKGAQLMLFTNAEVQLYRLESGQKFSISCPNRQVIRAVAFGIDDQLMTVSQSMERHYEWQLNVYNTSHVLTTLFYSTQFDVDPDDRLETIRLNPLKDESIIYELRQCTANVSEVWKAVPTRKKNRTKLKETLLYQRGTVRYTDMQVREERKMKQTIIFVWDELSCCIYRLLIRNGHCELTSKLMHAAHQVPFNLDNSARLWCFDAHLDRVVVSTDSTLNQANVVFRTVCDSISHSILKMVIVNEDVVYGLVVTASTVVVLRFIKKIPQ